MEGDERLRSHRPSSHPLKLVSLAWVSARCHQHFPVEAGRAKTRASVV